MWNKIYGILQWEKIVSMLKRIIIALTIACFALAETKATPKYIFLFIGDSMGLGHIMATEEYLRTNEFELLLMFGFPNVGIMATFSASSPITDSAAAGTALACGHKANRWVWKYIQEKMYRTQK